MVESNIAVNGTQKPALTEEQQSECLQQLMNQFSYLDEVQVINAFFTQSSCDYQKARQLLQELPKPKHEVNQKNDRPLFDDDVQNPQDKEQSSLVDNNSYSFDDMVKQYENSVPEQARQSIVPQSNEAPSLDISDQLYKETLLQMRIALGSDQAFFNSLKTMQTVINNIQSNPWELKYQKLRLSNKGVQQAITNVSEAMFLLEMLCFEQQELVVENKPDYPGQTDVFLVLNAEKMDLRDFQSIKKIIDDVSAAKSLVPLTDSLNFKLSTPKGPNEGSDRAKSAIPMNFAKHKQLQQIANTDKIAKQRLLDAAMQRNTRKVEQPELYDMQRIANQQYSNLEAQLETYKQSQRSRYRANLPKQMTLQDSQNLVNQDVRMRNNAQMAGKSMQEQWGIRALDLTNQFRASQGNLPALAWNQALHDIAMVHSKDMAEGRVPFGHQGFSQRAQKVPFFKRSFSENVAYNYGQADPVECAVVGWINSPGHRKNMLATNSICAIAVYVHFGKFYFTQLFALC